MTTRHTQGKPRLLECVRIAVRTRHMSRRTEDAYVCWIRRFILFHRKRHPAEMGAKEVSASTQNQALSALLFLYKDTLNPPFGDLDGMVHAT